MNCSQHPEVSATHICTNCNNRLLCSDCHSTHVTFYTEHVIAQIPTLEPPMTPSEPITTSTPIESAPTVVVEPTPELRHELEARIAALESDLSLIQQGKEAAERALQYERDRARELAQNGTLSLKRDWVGLVNELRILKGETLGENDPNGDTQYQEALVIDFVNRLRIGALAELQADDDETLYVKAKAYEVWYRACTATLQNRAIRLKIEKRDDFEKSKADIKKRESDARVAKEQSKLDKRRKTPFEKAVESAMLLGLSQAEAENLVKNVQGIKPEVVQ